MWIYCMYGVDQCMNVLYSTDGSYLRMNPQLLGQNQSEITRGS